MKVDARVDAAIADLKRRTGAIATAIVGRDGVARAAELPDGVPAEPYAMMCATAMGAAGAAQAAIGQRSPGRLMLAGTDSLTILGALGPAEFLALTVGSEADLVRVTDEVARFVGLETSRGRIA